MPAASCPHDTHAATLALYRTSGHPPGALREPHRRPKLPTVSRRRGADGTAGNPDVRRRRCSCRGGPDAHLIESGDALVRVTRAAVCGSDLWPYKSMEPSETGGEWDTSSSGSSRRSEGGRHGRKGDLVVSPFLWSDGTCAFCLARPPQLLSPRREIRLGRCRRRSGRGGACTAGRRDPCRLAGGEGRCVDVRRVLALTDVMGTGHHAAVEARVDPGKTVAVVGDGAVGLCGVIASKRSARIGSLLGRRPDRARPGEGVGATEHRHRARRRGSGARPRAHRWTRCRSVLECVGLEEAVVTALEPRPRAARSAVSAFPRTRRSLGGVRSGRTSVSPVGRARSAHTSRSCRRRPRGKDRAGRVSNRMTDLDGVPDGYRAMRRARVDQGHGRAVRGRQH